MGEIVGALRQGFTKADENSNGRITWNTFQSKLNHPGMRCIFEAVDLDLSEARNLFRLLDLDEVGAIRIDEIVHGCLRLRGVAKSIDVAALLHESRCMGHRMNKVLHLISTTVSPRQELESPPRVKAGVGKLL